MDINGRQITYKGNYGWDVDGVHATAAAFGSSDLILQGTREVVPLTAEQASAISAEREAIRNALRTPAKPTVNRRPYIGTSVSASEYANLRRSIGDANAAHFCRAFEI